MNLFLLYMRIREVFLYVSINRFCLNKNFYKKKQTLFKDRFVGFKKPAVWKISNNRSPNFFWPDVNTVIWFQQDGSMCVLIPLDFLFWDFHHPQMYGNKPHNGLQNQHNPYDRSNSVWFMCQNHGKLDILYALYPENPWGWFERFYIPYMIYQSWCSNEYKISMTFHTLHFI